MPRDVSVHRNNQGPILDHNRNFIVKQMGKFRRCRYIYSIFMARLFKRVSGTYLPTYVLVCLIIEQFLAIFVSSRYLTPKLRQMLVLLVDVPK